MNLQPLKSASRVALLACFCTLPPGYVLAATNSTTIAVTSSVINFGAFIVLAGCANCSITISPTGVRSVAGAILLSNVNAGSAATFSVTQNCQGGNPKCTGYTPTAVATAILPAGGVNMTLSAFTFNPPAGPTGAAGLVNTLAVGATLTIPSQGAAGTFNGGGFTLTTSP